MFDIGVIFKVRIHIVIFCTFDNAFSMMIKRR